MPDPTPLPDRLTNARRMVLRPDLVVHLPAATASAWFDLKADQGHPVPPSRMDRLNAAHLMRNPVTGVVDYIDATRARVVDRIRAMQAQHKGGTA